MYIYAPTRGNRSNEYPVFSTQEKTLQFIADWQLKQSDVLSDQNISDWRVNIYELNCSKYCKPDTLRITVADLQGVSTKFLKRQTQSSLWKDFKRLSIK